MAQAQPAAAYKTPEWPVPSTLNDNDTIGLRGQQEKILMAAAETAETDEVAEAAERKGPWTKEEDAQLVWYVSLFGERRWDHLAKVSGLNRSGKSCRLRWVNYLHPGLKHGRLNLQEELLVLQLHAKWGNRWSRIAACLPGRTDNEIKNYWRTHMRKEAQERKSLTMNSSSLSWMSTSSSASSWFHGSSASGNGETSKHGHETESAAEEAYSMDEIWAEIDAAESVSDEFKNDCTGERFPWKQEDDEEFIHHDH